MKSRMGYLMTVVLFAAMSAQAQQTGSGSLASSAAVVPQLIKFSGVAKAQNGKPPTGTVGITFALYKDEQGGAPLWLETQNVQPDAHGSYTVQLGTTQVNGLPTELFTSGEARWLGVQVQGQSEQERVLLLAVPYALKALDAETVGGRPASAFALASPATATVEHKGDGSVPSQSASSPVPPISGGGTKGYIPEWLSATKLGNSVLFQTSAGHLGVSTTAPAEKFEVDLGNLLVRGPNNFTGGGDSAFLYVGDSHHPIEAIHSNPNTHSGGLAIGTFKAPQLIYLQDATGNVGIGIGTAAPSARLDVNGTVNSASGFNLGGKAFAFGSYANQNAFSGFAGNSGIVAQGNTGFGYRALNSDIGYLGGSGSNNTAVGDGALYSNNEVTFIEQEASENTAVGFSALYHNTLGGENTAVGSETLLLNTQGSGNTAVGKNTLAYNLTGGQNTANGYDALLLNDSGGYNTAIGAEALSANVGDSVGDGWWNAAMGAYALINNTMGSDNTASGPYALIHNTTGSSNTGLGNDADVGSGNLSNATAIGANAYVTQSDTLVLGCVSGVNNCLGAVSVGIGTTAPDNVLTVNGSADKPGGGSWGTYSDRRLKTLDGSFSSGLTQIMKLHPVRYRYNKENAMGIQDEEEHVGLVAQDVQAIIPEAVTKNSKGYLLLNNDPILWSMLNAIKEEQAMIHQQQQRISVQQAQVKTQQAEIARLSSQVKAIQASLKTSGRTDPQIRTAKAQMEMMHQ